MYCKLDTVEIEITRSFESEYNNSPQFEIYTENRYMGTLSLAIAPISILIAIGDGTETLSNLCPCPKSNTSMVHAYHLVKCKVQVLFQNLYT